MRKFFTIVISALVLVAPALVSLPRATANWEMLEFIDQIQETVSPLQSDNGSYIVMLKDGETVVPGDIVKQHSLSAKKLFERIQGFSAQLDATQVELLKNDPRVAIVEPDFVVTAWSHNSIPSQTMPTGINRIDAELSPLGNINNTDNRVDVDVAVIDSGVQKTHPDLNVVSVVNFSDESSTDDRNGHGTHVAGTIGALDNKAGVVGVAPGARIWAIKVLDRNGSGMMSDIIAGVDYVTAHAHEIEVANMSLGCDCISEALNAALKRSVNAGVVYVVAAGNSAKDAAKSSPANHPDVITVSAIADFNGLPGGNARSTCRRDVDDTFADFSNYGSVVDIAAPGVCINSTWKGSTYSTISGTSMASPHVAGAAALYIAKNGKPNDASGAEAVKNALISAGKPQNDAAGFTGDPDGSKEVLLNVGGI